MKVMPDWAETSIAPATMRSTAITIQAGVIRPESPEFTRLGYSPLATRSSCVAAEEVDLEPVVGEAGERALLGERVPRRQRVEEGRRRGAIHQREARADLLLSHEHDRATARKPAGPSRLLAGGATTREPDVGE